MKTWICNVGLLFAFLLAGPEMASAANVALGKTAIASTTQAGFPASNAVDGVAVAPSRWASIAGSDTESIYVDLGAPTAVSQVILRWEAAYGSAYNIQFSNDAASWTTPSGGAMTGQDGGTDTITVSGTTRYVKMQGVTRGTVSYGYSLYEFEIYDGGAVAAPVISGATSATGTVGTPFSFQVTASNSPTSYAATGLPAGLSINTITGLISGTPTTAGGPTTVNLSATNGTGTGTGTLAITINTSSGSNLALNGPVTYSSFQAGNLGSYGNDGSATTRWAAVDGTFPQWWRVDLGSNKSVARVDIAWINPTTRAYKYTIETSTDDSNYTQRVDKSGNTTIGESSDTFTAVTARYVRVTVTGSSSGGFASFYEVGVFSTGGTLQPPSITSATTGTGTVSTAYSYQITATNSPTSFNATNLPAGLSVNTTTGLISGTPTAAGAKTVALTATNAAGSGTANLALTINAAGAVPVINSAATASGVVNTAFSYQITATNTPTGFTATGLPAGLTVNATTGLISGTPTAVGGPTAVTLRASNGSGQSAVFTLNITITSAPPAGNLALNKVATASTPATGTVMAPKAVDGIATTRWQATKQGTAFDDASWIQVDLGQPYQIGKVVLKWESAYGKDYKIQTSLNGTTWADSAVLTGMTNTPTPIVHTITVGGYYGVNTRYVRMQGVTRGTGYGYSLYEFEVYGWVAPPNQTGNQTIKLNYPVEGLAYASIAVSPVPLSVTPTPTHAQSNPNGSFLVVQNPEQPVTYNLTFPANTVVTVTKSNFSSGIPLADLQVQVTDYKGDLQSGNSVQTLAQNNANWNLVVIQPPPTGNNPPANWINDPYTAPAPPAVTGAFGVSGPGQNAMITNTRRPAFSWTAVSGATGYDLYVNKTRTDYDWNAKGNLLDRFTKMNTATITGTSYTLQEDLVDRWTYKWYVVASTGARSDMRTFSLYLPVVETIADGVNIINGCRDMNKNGTIEPYEDWHNSPATRVNDLLGRMTTQQKAMQVFFNTQEYPLSGFGFGPFAPADALTYQKAAAATPLGIPHIVLGDTIHGLKTSYPIQPGLTATRDQQIAWEVSDMQRREMYGVGNRGTLSPLAEVGTKVLYPRIQEGGGEDGDWVAGQVRAMVAGLQAGPEINPRSVMLTVKHWPSQGGGGEALVVYDGTSIWYHMRPWHAAMEANAACIMPGYSGSWLLNTAGRGAGDDPGIIGFLRNTIGFQGIICTDWLPEGAWANCLAAGSDVMGGANPAQMGTFATTANPARLDEAVRRVLDIKFRMGVFEDPYGANVNGTSAWHTSENADTAYNAASQSLTLLKNDGALPLRSLNSGDSIVVDGVRSDDPACMTTWTSGFHETDYGMKTFYNAIKARAALEGVNVYNPRARTPAPVPGGVTPKHAIVIVGESYYTHGTWWKNDTPYLPDDPIGPSHNLTPGEVDANYDGGPSYSVIQSYRNAGIPTTVVVVLPRPYVLTNVNTLANAMMVVYRPGDYGGTALADLLFGDFLPKGKLPWQLPRSMAQIGGIVTADWQTYTDAWDLPYDMGATTGDKAAIKAVIASGGSFPADPGYGDPLYRYGAGIQGFGLTDASAPAAFSTTSPSNGQAVTATLPNFAWNTSSDAQTGIQKYDVYIDNVLVYTTKKGTSFNLSAIGRNVANGTHNWYVKATNWANGSTNTPTVSFTINDTTAPAAFVALSPAASSTVPAGTATFIWEQSTDTGTGIKNYVMKLDGADQPAVTPTTPPVLITDNIAKGKDADASSVAYGGTARASNDGDLVSRWGSAATNTEWWQVDLAAPYSIKTIVIRWEAAYGKDYDLQVSLDGATWTTIKQVRGAAAGVHTHNAGNGLATGVGRYVRMQGVTRGTTFGYSIYEFEVNGVATEQKTLTVGAGAHTWAVRAVDGGNNTTNNSNGTISFTKQ